MMPTFSIKNLHNFFTLPTFLRKLGSEHGERARDLAYRLYSICEHKGLSSEAVAYNSLIIAWPEISKLARTPKKNRVNLYK